jgi:hypothetical protein
MRTGWDVQRSHLIGRQSEALIRQITNTVNRTGDDEGEVRTGWRSARHSLRHNQTTGGEVVGYIDERSTLSR